ncbi:MAG: riboflavin synthase [Terriglobales bacterium]
MFTGIVQCVGRVATLERRGAGARLQVGGAEGVLRGLKRGDSIAVNGCCLTIVAKRSGMFSAELSRETLARTALGELARGQHVNLEPPLRAGDSLSGHLMQGHVEATGRFTSLAPAGSGREAGWRLRLELPAGVLAYVVPQGSLAVDGISLTVAALDSRGAEFAIIPFTYARTNLSRLQPGAAVNLETDPLARHAARYLETLLRPVRSRTSTGRPRTK